MNLTYNLIIRTFREFADAHLEIQNFGNGDIWEIVEHNQLLDWNFPLLWVADQPASIGDGTFTWNFNVLTMSLVDKDETNENDVKSDMAQVLLDLLAYLEQKTAETGNVTWMRVQLVKSGSMTSFTERFEDEVTGWGMTIGLQIPLKYDNCNLPMT